MKKVKFKSDDLFFYKERSGKKNNTVRKIDETDKRFKHLMDIHADDSLNGDTNVLDIDVIEIENAERPKEKFTRIIKDVSFFNDEFVIITWWNGV